MALKDVLLCVFSAPKVDIGPLKSKLLVKNWPSERVILTILGAKKVVFWTLEVVLEMFRSCLGIIFGLKRLTFECIFSSKGRYLTSKIKNVGQKLALCEGYFDHFGGPKSRFFDFFKVVLEMLRSWLSIIFGFKRPTFMYIFSSKGRIYDR